MDNKIKFTKQRLEKIPLPDKGRKVYFDIANPDLALRVTSTGRKSFVVIKKLNGRPKYVTLGQFPSMSIQQASIKSRKVAIELSEGHDPNAKRIQSKLENITLEQCFEAYMESKTVAQLSEGSRKSYKAILNNWLSDWKNKPLKDITTNLVNQRFREISKEYPIAANNTFRFVRAIFNFAQGEWEDSNGDPLFPNNPVKKLTHKKRWHKEERRQGVLKNYELEPWFKALELFEQTGTAQGGVAPSTFADYFRFVLMTGLRRREASNLRWSDIDFKGKTISIEQTKNKQTHIIPITSYVMQLLERRSANRVNDFVFEGRGGVSLQEPKKAIEKIRALSDVYFTVHDLRRTFISVAESLELSPYAIKRMVNHKIPEADVTGGYIVWEIERLRAPMEKINEYILQLASVIRVDNVIDISKQGHIQDKG